MTGQPATPPSGTAVFAQIRQLLTDAGVAHTCTGVRFPCLTVTAIPLDLVDEILASIHQFDARKFHDTPTDLKYTVHTPDMSFNIELTSDQVVMPARERNALIAARAVLDLYRLLETGGHAAATARYGAALIAQATYEQEGIAYYWLAMAAVDAAPDPLFGQAPIADDQARMLATLLLDNAADLTDDLGAVNALIDHPDLVVTAALLDREPVRVTPAPPARRTRTR